jgi:hypothetical protein
MRKRGVVLCFLYLFLCGLANGQQLRDFLSIKVLQTEQVPYTVQVRGGQVNTSCSIMGTGASVYMSCSSYETPPVGWRHVLSASLVVASDGNAYIIACDAAWRWSKCRGLRAGDTFAARWAQRGLAVSYSTDKGKRKEATYSVVVSKSLK